MEKHESRLKYEYTLGNIIMKMREEKGYTQNDLCKGICSQKMMSRYESWSCVPDRLSLNLIIQRLGKAPSHFVTVITQKELLYFQWKKKILEKVGCGDTSAIKTLLESDIAKDRSCNAKIQEQFSMYISGYIENDCEKMRSAIELTIPDFKDGVDKVKCISTSEINLILLYLEKKIELKFEGQYELAKCLEFIEMHFDKEEQIYSYPVAVQLYCKYVSKNIYERVQYCKKAIDLLTNQARVQELPILLKIIADDLQEIGDAEAKKYKNYLWSFQELHRELHLELPQERSVLRDMQQEVYALNDVIKAYRLERGLSREETSADICDVATYGRIESGARGINRSNYDKITQRLDIPYGKYTANIITNDYECIKLTREIETAVKQRKLNDVADKISKLESKIDMLEKINFQYIVSQKNALHYYRRELTSQKMRENAMEAIRITIPNWNEEYGIHFYSKTELKLINQIAVSFAVEKNYEKADLIIRNVWKELNVDTSGILMRIEEIILLLSSWKNILSAMGRYEEALEISDQALAIALDAGYGDKLDTFLYEKGWINERMPISKGNSEAKALKYCLQAFYMSELYMRNENCEIARKHLKEKYCKII